MYETLKQCPSCGHISFKNKIICEDHAATHESFALVECQECSLVFTNPRPSQENIDKYYSHENYISHTNKANNLTNLLYKIVRNYTLNQKLQLIKKQTNKKRLLDFGCGTGIFCHKMYANKFEVVGYEPSKNVDHKALSQSIAVYKDLSLLKKERPFDTITAWHTIEHVHDLTETIKLLHKLLRKNGILIMAVPNHKSHDAKHYKEYWAAYDVPRHLYHFSRNSVHKLMTKKKFTLIDTLPMKFDSFYVSMLSEKYKNNKANILKALKTGLLSNKLASTSGEYSSLIYVCKKQ